MFDAKSLLNQFLGGNLSGRPFNPKGSSPTGSGGQGFDLGNLGDLAKGLGGMSGGQKLAAGGLLAMLIGSKKGRRMAGSLVTYGGAAALGLLAYRAFRNWQEGQKPETAAPASNADISNVEPQYLPSAAPAATGEAFELSLVRAMIAAAKADGHMDAVEQGRLFTEINNMGMDSEAKGFVFDLLAKPVSLDDVARTAQSPEQGAELYLASRLAIDPDDPAEKAYLEALAARLKLPPELVAHLEHQVEATMAQKDDAAE